MKEPNPLQKPQVSPRFRMAQSGQGRQMLKIFSPLDWTRKESLFLQPKSEAHVGRIRFLVRHNWDFHPAPCVMHARVRVSHRRYHPYLLDCCQSNICLIAARASMGIWRSCFFFSSTAGAIQTCLVAARARSWIGRLHFFFSSTAGAIRTCSIATGARLRIYRSRVPFFLQLASDIGLSKSFYVHCTFHLSYKKVISFHFTYPFFPAIIVL